MRLSTDCITDKIDKAHEDETGLYLDFVEVKMLWILIDAMENTIKRYENGAYASLINMKGSEEWL
jgi:hypothetical protein